MKFAFWGLAVLLAAPALLLAIALGPVIVGILCAIGFGLIVFAIANAVLGLGVAGRAVGARSHRSRV